MKTRAVRLHGVMDLRLEEIELPEIKDGEILARRSLDPAMNNLQVLVQNNLRRGDVIARCSISQYIILLPQANYENSRMVADRLVSAFYRRYPHSPARLRYTVQPLA